MRAHTPFTSHLLRMAEQLASPVFAMCEHTSFGNGPAAPLKPLPVYMYPLHEENSRDDLINVTQHLNIWSFN